MFLKGFVKIVKNWRLHDCVKRIRRAQLRDTATRLLMSL